VRHLIELHGGTVSAESDGRDAGSRFLIRLPRAAVPVNSPDRDRRQGTAGFQEAASLAAVRLDGVRVMVVDDDRESCEVMREALQGVGASVQIATSVDEAVTTLSNFTPDVVLSDLAMPGRDGFGVLTAVRAITQRRIPVIAVTAYARAEDRERVMTAGFDDYLAKPVAPMALAAAVATHAVRRDPQLFES
jgi:CheY-like chemotaxis protein